jgi:biopolymer transport protein ExbD
MPKVKVARKSTRIDMTAMCDVAFLLLTFFILTAKFSVSDPIKVTIPTSISEIKIPEVNICKIIIGSNGKVFFGIDNQEKKEKLINKMAEKYKVTLTQKQIRKFSSLDVWGVPMNLMPKYLDLRNEDRDKPENALGIPCDSTNNELAFWIQYAREVNPDIKIAVKGDKDTPYPIVRKVVSTLQDRNENKFNLITGLEANPLDEKDTAPGQAKK